MSAYYIQQPDGQLQLFYGTPPAGLVQVGGAPAQMPRVTASTAQPLTTAQSMPVTPQPAWLPTTQSMVVTGPQQPAQPQYTGSVGAAVFGATHTVGNAFTRAGAGLASATGSVVHGAGNLISSGVGAVGSGVGYATHAMGNTMSPYAPTAVSNVTAGIVHGTGNAVSGVTKGIGNATAGVTGGIGNAITGAGAGVSSAVASGEKTLESNFTTTPGSKTEKKASKKKKSSGSGCC